MDDSSLHIISGDTSIIIASDSPKIPKRNLPQREKPKSQYSKITLES